MLRNLLEVLREKECHSSKELALAIGESEEMVTVLLQELEKRGVIRSAQICGAACEGCPVKTGCKKEIGRVYFLKK